MPFAQFMGEVPVPLYQSPYAVTSGSNGVPFNVRSAAPSSITTYISTNTNSPSNNYRQPRGATVYEFLPTGILTRNAGNTSAPRSGESLSTNNFAFVGNALYVGSLFNSNIFNKVPTIYTTTYNFGASNSIPDAPAQSTYVGFPGFSASTASLGGMGECVVNFLGYMVKGAVQFISRGDGTPGLVAEIPFLNLPGFGVIPSPLLDLSTITPNILSTEFFYPICFPDYSTGITHCYFQKNDKTAIRYLAFKTFIQVTGQTTYQIVGNEYFTFDNALMNSRITTGGGRTYFSYNGFLFSTTNATDPTGTAHDYFIAYNGLKYWRLNYVSQIAGFTPNTQLAGYGGLGQDGTATVSYIDAAGIYWYAGTSTVSGGQSHPLYSFGVNVNFSPIAVPAIPPFKLPCWSPCLNFDSPLAKVPQF